MKPAWWIRFLAALGAAIIAVSCVDERSPALHFERAARGAPGSAVPAPLRAAYVAAVQRRAPPEYRFQATADGLRAEGAAQGLRAELREGGVEVTSAAGGWSFDAAAARWGCDGEMEELGAAKPEAEGNKATYRRRGLEEWYVNGPLGLEQGFTLPAPPPCRGAGQRGVAIEIGGGLDASVLAGGKDAVLSDAEGRAALRYGELLVVDAAGRELDAWLTAEAGRLSLRFDDAEAEYPVTVDPLIWVPQATLAVSGGVGEGFGCSAAIDGDTAIVGAELMASQRGAVYVFVRSGSTWSEQAKLTASDGAPNDSLGISLALSGDTAIVGAHSVDMPTAFNQGAAYVFVRTGSSWSQQAKLTASDGAQNDYFAESVAVDGDTAVVGQNGYPYKPTDKGAAYVFVRSGSTWSEQAKLTASDGVVGDGFLTVGLRGDTVVVGANGVGSLPGAAYVFVRSGSSWSQQQKLTPSDGAPADYFGTAVSVSGDTLIVGAAGSASNKGAAYVFVRSGSLWSQQAKLTASDGAADEYFGSPVALSGDTAVVAATWHATKAGSAYVFVRSGSSWSEQQELLASPGWAGENFGLGLGVSGDTAVVSGWGAGYVFVVRSSDGDPCTTGDKCVSGYCVDGICCSVASCVALDQCHAVGTCQAGTGVCANPVKPDGSPCDDGNADTTGDVCTSGACAGVDHCIGVTCAALDQCHSAGTCVDHATGACDNPVRVDGTACDDGNADTTGDVCTSGACAGVDHCIGVTCAALDQCHSAGTCVDHATGACDNPVKADGAPCSKGTCQQGTCTPLADAGPDSGTGGSGGSGGSGTTTTPTSSGGAGTTTTTTGGAGGATGDTTTRSTEGGTTDLNCQCGVPGAPGSWRAGWLAVAAVLVLRRRREGRATPSIAVSSSAGGPRTVSTRSQSGCRCASSSSCAASR